MRVFLLLFFCLTANISWCQVTTKICFKTNRTALIKIDGQLRSNAEFDQLRCIEVNPGEHEIEIWAPKYMAVKDTIVVAEGETFKYAKALTIRSESFKEFQIEQELYVKQRNKNLRHYLLLSSGIAAAGTWALISRKNLINRYDNLQKIESEYQNGSNPFVVKRKRVEYSEAQEEYAKKRKQLVYPIAFSIGFGTSIGWSIFKKKDNQVPKPIFVPVNPWE